MSFRRRGSCFIRRVMSAMNGSCRSGFRRSSSVFSRAIQIDALKSLQFLCIVVGLRYMPIKRASPAQFPEVSGSEPETVVIFVCSNPKPSDHVAFAHTYRAVVFPDSHDTYSISPLLEPERRMMRMLFPERVFFARKFLYGGRQSVEVLPESRVRSADHGRS